MILRENLEINVPISDLSEKYNVYPNAIYTWRKQVIESAPANLSKVEIRKAERLLQDQIRENKELKKTLAKRESLIAELVEDNIILKKSRMGKTRKTVG